MSPYNSTRPVPRSTRSVLRSKFLVLCLLLVVVLMMMDNNQSSQLDLEDALYLTKNSIKEFRDQYLPTWQRDNNVNTNSSLSLFEIDYPLNSVMNSFFPIDTLISYNTTIPNDDSGNITVNELVGRYASFSPVLSTGLESKYVIFPNNACEKKDYSNDKEFKKYFNKTLVVLRGDCTFVDKVSNLLESGLNPTSIIVGNDEPYRGLITMFSGSFNQDGSLDVPILFITNEDYKTLKEIESEELTITISTLSIGSWVNILVSMVLSPPLLILFFYSVVVCGQRFRRRQADIRNAKLVKKLPVYIFNKDHLIHVKYFMNYLKITGQTSVLAKDYESTLPESPKNSPSSSTASLSKIVVNGIDIRSSSGSLHVLCAPNNFYPAYKCSICLDKYIPLKSRVLVLDCKHFYHEKCLSNWLINFKRTCPLCNTIINHSNDPYLLAGQNNSGSDYGSMDDTDLEAARNLVEDIPYVTDSYSQIESDEDDRLYHDYNVAGTSSSIMESTLNTGSSLLGGPLLRPVTPPPHDLNLSKTPMTPTDSHTSASFVTANTNLESPKIRGGSGLNSPIKYVYARPSQILSQFSSISNQNQTRSVSEFSNSVDSMDWETPGGNAIRSPPINENDETITSNYNGSSSTIDQSNEEDDQDESQTINDSDN
ncbi:hypothetical protein DFJ63DRAFT_291231 [Scheffersomyces coipomensis]|uniref:uncharacterized protein n=1 Tax=Scheffersomyces coipomensis TaxID=1788519 RepID=UPI00315C997B